MAYNPFEAIHEEFKQLREQIAGLAIPASSTTDEIISRHELCKRLNITEPTAIRLGKRGELPEIRLGDSVRYNWRSVIGHIEQKNNISKKAFQKHACR
jgi:hypothetical protein